MKNTILVIIVIIFGLGIYGIIGFIIFKFVKKKEAKIKEILENSLKREDAQKIINKREKYSSKALKFLTWYYPIFGIICIILGSIPIYLEIKRIDEKFILSEIIKGILAILLGLYLLISGTIDLYNYIKSKKSE
jgi:uncharacterized membrane protein HdeD (DUF308 family)